MHNSTLYRKKMKNLSFLLKGQNSPLNQSFLQEKAQIYKKNLKFYPFNKFRQSSRVFNVTIKQAREK